MKRIILITLIGCLLTIGSSSLFAQRSKCQMKKKCRGVELTEDQKTKMKKIRLNYAEATLQTKNQLNEVRAKKQSLLSSKNPNQKEIYALIDQKADLQRSLSAERMKMRLAMHSLLTDEQRMKADFYRGKFSNHKGGKHFRGKGRMQAKQGFRKQNCIKGEKRKHAKMSYLDLNEKQKEDLKSLRIKHRKETQELRNQMEELRLKQKHLLTAETIDQKLMSQNSVKMIDVRTQLEKMKVKHEFECRKIFTDEQLILFLSHKGKGTRKARFH